MHNKAGSFLQRQMGHLGLEWIKNNLSDVMLKVLRHCNKSARTPTFFIHASHLSVHRNSLESVQCETAVLRRTRNRHVSFEVELRNGSSNISVAEFYRKDMLCNHL